MTKKKWTNVFLALLFSVATLSSVACEKEDGGENNVRVWSTYNTLKVLRDYEGPPYTGGKYPDLGADLEIKMCLGETEGAQLLVTPEKAVKSAYLHKGTLKDEEGTDLSEDSVTVYYQYYHELLTKTTSQTNYNYPLSWVPDMIVPMEICAEYEENKIGAGHNQGFTVEVKTTPETKAGVYSGVFVLELDGKKTNIPVRVEVLNIDISESHGSTSIWTSSTTGRMSGEYNTTSYYKNYYETSLYEYDFCCDYVPGSNYPDEMAQSVSYYFDHPNFTSYQIPTLAQNKKIKKGDVFDYLYELAIASKPGRILLDAAYFCTIADEPDPAEYDACTNFVTDLYEVEEKVIEELRKENFYEENGYDEAYREQLEKTIMTLPIVQTASQAVVGTLGEKINTYCPYLSVFGSMAAREQLSSLKEITSERGGETWYYTCMGPIYPHPSDHLDDNLIGLRMMRWMQKDYGMDGYLHWSFFRYYVSGGSNNADPYATTERFPGTPGDGFKTYPGYKYGLDTYLPSIRLSAFRDGQEDYDLLCVLDELIAEREQNYGLEQGTVDARSFVSELYQTLYTGTVYNESDETFYSVREKLFDLVEIFSSESGFLVTNTKTAQEVVSNVYLAKGYDLKINGQALAVSEGMAQGNRYELTQLLTGNVDLDVEILKDGKVVETFYMFLAGATYKADLMKEGAIAVSDDGRMTQEDGKVFVTLYGKENGGRSFNPYVSFNCIEQPLNKIDTLTFTLTNLSEQELVVKSRLKSGYQKYNLTTYKLAAGETKTIVVSEMYAYGATWSDALLETATFELYMDNVVNTDGNKQPEDEGYYLPILNVSVEDVIYSMTREG